MLVIGKDGSFHRKLIDAFVDAASEPSALQANFMKP